VDDVIFVVMSNFTLNYFAEDTDACKIVIAAELSGVALSLNEIQSRDSGMNITSHDTHTVISRVTLCI